jgi:hypothetical protein
MLEKSIVVSGQNQEQRPQEERNVCVPEKQQDVGAFGEQLKRKLCAGFFGHERTLEFILMMMVVSKKVIGSDFEQESDFYLKRVTLALM